MALMTLVDRVLERRSLENPADWLLGMFGARSTSSGVTVTPEGALHHPMVWACTRVIAETVGSLPQQVFRHVGDATEKLTDHAAYWVLHDEPNSEQTPMEFREMMQAHVCLRGNAFAEIIRDGGGKVRELWPMHPGRVRVVREAAALVYYYRPMSNLSETPMAADRVLHLRGLSSDGVMGLSPIELLRETLGTAFAQEEFDARFFSNGATPPAVVEYPGNLSADKQRELRASLYDQVGGLTRAHRFLLLQGGLKWTNVGMTLRDAQFIEGRKLSDRAIARGFRMQAHKVGDLEHATFSNIEHMAIEHVTDTIRPWSVRWDQKCTKRLLTERERKILRVYIETNLEGLLRGDITTRYNAYAIGRTNGWLSADDIRERENMNPLPDGQGKTYLIPLNMVPVDQPRPKPALPRPPKALLPADDDDDVIDAEEERARHLLDEATGRIVRREGEALRRAAIKSGSDAAAWRAAVAEFYARHAAYIAESLGVEIDRAQPYVRDHLARVLADGLSVLDDWETESRAALVRVYGERRR